ncbi:ATP-dependent DNA helicase [Pilatotrama ljubarskyi]|nr:ATP-dependent DNA helicase [Pilatotrama ljubarskyi]
MKAVFGFNSFRLCQEGICNASMDGRDIVAIMPTGGGKSLGYQLPALMVPGCTVVISPLLSLIADQIMHLREAGVDAVMLTGGTSKAETAEIYRRLQDMASGVSSGPDIKLCYVTPEKVAKSTRFSSALEKLYRVNKLARFVVDEAHCVSQQGHDFRPDYQKLSMLRQVFPKVPILALSATCPPAVLRDLLKTLRLPAPVSGTAASTQGTVLFTAPLYRKNLHYAVVPKPSTGQDSIDAMRDYILTKHRNDTGIIYCLSKKDAEHVAKALYEGSERKILTGVYHADIPDATKEALHKDWREGKIKVVCATIAFGLGIDKGDVRFVLHHTVSKTIDGFYQESGRAGRDGQDADCVLYYRPQDATRIAALTCGERQGQEKVLDMLRFASDLEECRKIQFARYFSASSNLSIDAWGTADEDALTRCGHCDNCTRPPETVDRRDVRLPAWQLLKLATVLHRARESVTMAQLCSRARGLRASGATDGAKGRGRGKRAPKEKVNVDLQEVAGGKIELTQEQTEALCVRLLVDGYLDLDFSPTAYTINVYFKPSDTATRFTRFSRAEIEQGKGPQYECTFLKKVTKRKGANAGGGATEKEGGKAGNAKSASRGAKGKATAGSSGVSGKRKRRLSESSGEEDGDDDEDEGDSFEFHEDGEDDMNVRPPTRKRQPLVSMESEDDNDENDEPDMQWSTTLRGATAARPAAKRPRRSRAQIASGSSRTTPPNEVIELSSD